MHKYNPTLIGCADGTTSQLDQGVHSDQHELNQQALHAEITRLNKVIHALLNLTEQIASNQEPDFTPSHTAIAVEKHSSQEKEAALLENIRTIYALRENETYFRQLFELHNDVMLLIDYQTRIIVDANPSAAQFYGYPLESLRGMNVNQINAQSESEIHPQRQKAIKGEQNIFTFDHRLANGAVRTVEAHISTVSYRSKNLFFSIIHDITERKLTEDALRVAAVAFETHDAILITNAAGDILSVNRAFTEITGYSSEEVLGENPRIMSSGKQNHEFYIKMWQQLLHIGFWTGEIWDRRKNGEIYPKWLTITAVKNEQQETIRYVAIFSDITDRKRAEEEMHNLAFYDSLTKLPNRRLLMDRLLKALAVSERSEQYGAVIFLDMDRFKTLNDAKGHDVGDMLLIEVAKRLQESVRDIDTVARLGGDEFVVLLEALSGADIEAATAARLVVEKIRTALCQPFQFHEYEYRTTASIGFSMFYGKQQSAEILLKCADQAMYQAKMAGRDAIHC